MKMDYKYKSPKVGSELDVFEDDDFSEYYSDTTFETHPSTSDTTDTDSHVQDNDNSTSEESVLHVTISFHSNYLSAI